MKSANRVYLPAIDQLRGFAALLIFYYHSYQLTFWKLAPKPGEWIYTKTFLLAALLEGHTAVSLFLVISGFILTFGTLDSPLNARLFFRNRALRILPMLAATILMGSYMVRYIDLVPALQLLSPLGGGLILLPWTGTVWSISVEAQLYLIFPYIHSQLRNRALSKLALIVVLVYVLRCAGLALGVDVKNLTYWTTLGHAEQFLAGAAGAWWLHSRQFVPRKAAGYVTAPVTLAIIICFLYGFHRAGGLPSVAWWRIFIPTVEAILWTVFVVSYLPFAAFVPAVLGRALSFVGKISYSVYLLHMTVITIFTRHGWFMQIPRSLSNSILLTATVYYLAPTLLVSWITFTLDRAALSGSPAEILRA